MTPKQPLPFRFDRSRAPAGEAGELAAARASAHREADEQLALLEQLGRQVRRLRRFAARRAGKTGPQGRAGSGL